MSGPSQQLTEQQVLDEGLRELRALLEGLTVERRQSSTEREAQLGIANRPDVILSIADPMGGSMTQVILEAKRYPTPAGPALTEALTLRLALMQDVAGQANAIVVAPWLGPKARGDLRRRGINYLDLTGNVSIRLPRPAVIIETSGSEFDPFARRGSGNPQFAGPKAARLVRFLADVIPPYRAVDIAGRTGLSQAYISRLLAALDERGLISRKGRQVIDVDWVELLRERGRHQGHLLSLNSWTGWYTRAGVEDVLNRLRGMTQGVFPFHAPGPTPVVTGSHAARAFAPLTVGGQLMLYVPAGTTDAWSDDLAITGPGVSGVEVVLLEPPDPVVFEGTITREGLVLPAPSQLVLDLLTGTGRQPQEGLAVLDALERAPFWREPLQLWDQASTSYGPVPDDDTRGQGRTER